MSDKRPFVGRHKELTKLRRLFNKKTSSLVVIKGRRRIGKSRLVEEFAESCRFLRFSGLPPSETSTAQAQRDEFALQLSNNTDLPHVTADDWTKLFILLSQSVQSGKVVILLDEISWMGDKDPDFLGKLKNAWDLHYSKNPELILILCGSVSAWVEKNILSSTGFVGRVSLQITLDELPLVDCSKLLHAMGTKVSHHDKLKILSVTGGVPKYIEEVYPNIEAEENIRRLCFHKSGLLFNEFPNIFTDLFSKRSQIYEKIVQSLVKGSASFSEVCDSIDLKKSGHINDYLNDLLASGFIARDYSWQFRSGKESKLSGYRLRDNYCRFYLKYIAPNRRKIEAGYFEERSLSSLPGWISILGLQFENLVLANRNFICSKLGFSLEDIVADNPYFQRTTVRHKGCQIDYLIQTRFNNLFACEIKFSNKEIGIGIIEEVNKRIASLAVPRGFSVFPILIHANGVKDEVVDSGFFSSVIDFSDALDVTI